MPIHFIYFLFGEEPDPAGPRPQLWVYVDYMFDFVWMLEVCISLWKALNL
jgi:hypothetical protein